MSSYIVDHKTINRIVATLDQQIQHHKDFSQFAKPAEGYLTKSKPAYLAHALYTMNLEAVCQRYPNDDIDGHPGPIDENGKNPPFQYTPVYPCIDPYQFLKSIQCYLYQCSEGDVPETQLYKELDEYTEKLALSIVMASEKYEKSQWT